MYYGGDQGMIWLTRTSSNSEYEIKQKIDKNGKIKI